MPSERPIAPASMATSYPPWLKFAAGPASLVALPPVSTAASTSAAAQTAWMHTEAAARDLLDIRLVPDVLIRHGYKLQKDSDPGAFSESCIVRSVMAAGGGFAMGGFFGAALAGFGGMGVSEMSPRDGISAGQAFKEGLVMMRQRAWSSAKNFALIGGVYSMVECPLESWRGKKDMKNAVLTGAITGAAVAARAGPKAMVMGAVGFSAFGVVMELLFPNLFDFGGG